MTKFAAKITSRGRITIDSKVRSKLGLEDGDWVVVELEPMDDDENPPWIMSG